jgi:hypothetical protein
MVAGCCYKHMSLRVVFVVHDPAAAAVLRFVLPGCRLMFPCWGDPACGVVAWHDVVGAACSHT